jgi:UDP-N-acetylmuramate dehydrogenase
LDREAALTKDLVFGVTLPVLLDFMESNTKEELKKLFPEIRFDVSLKKYTTFRIGGQAKYFFSAKTKEDLVKIVKTAKKLKIPFYILGGGSKLLISDKGFDGLVIRVENSEFEIKDDRILAGAGILIEELTRIALKESLSGVAWAAGIPGMVGGATRGNAGAFGKSMQDIIIQVEVFDAKKEKIINFNNKGCDFSYRQSIFKKNPDLIILSCNIQLQKGDKEFIKKEMESHINHRLKNHPINFPSAGCIFEGHYSEKEDKFIPAWKLIKDCGLVGKKIGDVKFSEQHSNFIVNLGNGKEEDVKKLIKIAKEKIEKKFGVVLKEELQHF